VRTVEGADDVVSPVGNAFPDDQCEVVDPDVHSDFWRQLAVHYPSNPDTRIGGLRMDGV
jgi:hypothetical protein